MSEKSPLLILVGWSCIQLAADGETRVTRPSEPIPSVARACVAIVVVTLPASSRASVVRLRYRTRKLGTATTGENRAGSPSDVIE